MRTYYFIVLPRIWIGRKWKKNMCVNKKTRLMCYLVQYYVLYIIPDTLDDDDNNHNNDMCIRNELIINNIIIKKLGRARAQG